ncbi:SgcJ/EcaC family oxidoreductase [Nodosilinea sp. FACHB-131]|uniref:YybH family protein n=1 Tax=Cyanophyceae TaxID=3028117 RepID=UPI001683A0C1|nr:SgcJ/EcaC family oxidoreductase [Nodosilinea sp. FACHB-131]MBD1874411.1 SgcJ/EcaC family oxidoreductase [Nodosilinea sp. FACHB-131]
MTSTSTITRDEAQIRQLIANQTSAITAKNLEQIMACYSPDAVLFDVKPPLQLNGSAAIRAMWEACMPCMPEISGIETKDLNVAVSGDLALAHWVFRFTGIEPGHPAAEMWMRVTAAYQKRQGEWQILHEHCSLPFNPTAGCAG